MTICFFSATKRVVTLAIWATLLSLALLVLLRSSSSSIHFRVLSDRTASSTHLDTIAEHPIRTLVRKAETTFDELLSRQSTSFEMAVSEYLRRYRRDPPPGFEGWYDYATKHDSMIIDDFDIIDETLAPFLRMSGVEVKRRLDHARDSIPLILHCRPSDHQQQAGCDPLGEGILESLWEAGILQHLPELDILISGIDEPRVLLRSDGGRVGHGDNDALADWTDFSHRHVWKEVTAGCPYDRMHGVKQTVSATRKLETLGLNLCVSTSDAIDLCRHPEYSDMHGFWGSPSNFNAIRSNVPILSTAVPSTMRDIPFPAGAYLNGAFTYEESEDIPWENKTAGLYWAGKTTGSFQEAAGQAWKKGHRQRFVSLANNLENRAQTYFWRSSESEMWQKHVSSELNQSLYSVHFTSVVQCADELTEHAIRDYFQIHDEDPRAEAFKYTLTFDLDGNGHSARFYRLLNSHSLPLKQTVFREWHDERLQPWLHYVPISLSMGDLPEVVRYLADEEEGRQVAALMAERGRQWSLRALRPADQAIYLYRLMLELARLQEPGRPALG